MCSSVSFLLYTSHWRVCTFLINISHWSRVVCARSQGCSLRVNHNIIHCCVVTVWKTDKEWQGISSTCNWISEGQGIFMLMPSMVCKRRGFLETVVEYWVLQIITYTIFVRNKGIIIRIIYFLLYKFIPVCNILMWEEICQVSLVLRPAWLIFRSKSDGVYLVVLTLGVRVVLLLSEESEVSATAPLSWLSSHIYSKFWAFRSNHGTDLDFPQRLISIPPNPPYLLNCDWNEIFLTLIFH